MCGIGGALVSDGMVVDAEALRRMGKVIEARGPDDEGLFVTQNVDLIRR